MPTAVIDGITTRYEVVGSGSPLLMFSPGGFDATVESWRTTGIYRRLDLLDRLPERYRCILFDRREAGESSGRVQRIGWPDYVAQAIGVLDVLGVDRAHVIGGCVGCSTAVAMGVAHPDRVASMVLYSPAGGVHYRRKQHDRFVRHLGFVAEHGLQAVVDLATAGADGFSQNPRVGPWVSVLRGDADFAKAYAGLDPAWYATVVTGTARLLYDRDTVSGAEPDDLLLLETPALVVPGQDSSHASSAAWYLAETLPRAEFWNVPVAEQTAANAPDRVLAFLNSVS